MLFKVAERLIKEHGYKGAERVLLENPDITAKLIVDEETPPMLKAYEIIADYILDMDMLFFGEKLKLNYEDENCRVVREERNYRTTNGTIFECLPQVFTREQLVQQCMMNNGKEPTKQKVTSMLFNWKQKKLIDKRENSYVKN